MNLELESNNYLIIKNFISSYEATNLSRSFNQYIEINEDKVVRDYQVPNALSVHNYIPFVEVLCHKLPEVSKIFGESLLPTYSYARVYTKGDVLNPHTDREACEVSLTLHLGGDTSWPIYIKTPSGETKSVVLEPGDAMMYLGRIASHWREEYTGTSYTQVFLHYVRTYGDCSFAYFDKNKINPDSVNIEDKKLETDSISEVEKKSPTLIVKKPSPTQTLEDFIQLFDNIVPTSLCDSILEHYINAEDWEPTLVGSGDLRKESRNCSGILMSDPNIIEKNFAIRKNIDIELHKFVLQAANQYKDIFSNFHADIDTGYQLLRYTEGQFYTQHTDSYSKEQRSVSCSITLNEDYEGGEFAFFDRELIFYPGKGSALLFPSNFMFPHEVMPVTKGTRYSIVTWYV